MTCKRLLAFALAAVATACGAERIAAQTTEPGLAALLAEAEAANPELTAARRGARAAAARVPQAGALPDPMLSFGVMNLPISDPSLGRDMMTMTRIRLSERFPWPGKLALREEIAGREAAAAEWEVERTRRRVLAEVKSTYYEVYFLDRALEVTGQNEAVMADFTHLTATRYGVGTGAQPDVLKAQVERTRLADQMAVLRERRTGALARLNALLARPTDTPLPSTEIPGDVRGAAAASASGDGPRFAAAALSDVLAGEGAGAEPAPGLPPVDDLQRLALENNPGVRAHAERVAARERSLRLAGKATLPDIDVTVGYSRRPDFGDFFDLMVSAPLPIFAGRKQAQAVLEEEALLGEHEARHSALVDGLRGEIASLAAELRRAREQLVLLNEGILPQARTSLASATASYQVGRVDFLTLLDAQVTLYRHELDYHRLLADFATNLAALERAVGTEVLP